MQILFYCDLSTDVKIHNLILIIQKLKRNFSSIVDKSFLSVTLIETIQIHYLQKTNILFLD